MDTSTYKPKNKPKAVLQVEEERKRINSLSGKEREKARKEYANKVNTEYEEVKKSRDKEAHNFVQTNKNKAVSSSPTKPDVNIKDLTFGKHSPENISLTPKVKSDYAPTKANLKKSGKERNIDFSNRRSEFESGVRSVAPVSGAGGHRFNLYENPTRLRELQEKKRNDDYNTAASYARKFLQADDSVSNEDAFKRYNGLTAVDVTRLLQSELERKNELRKKADSYAGMTYAFSKLPDTVKNTQKTEYENLKKEISASEEMLRQYRIWLNENEYKEKAAEVRKKYSNLKNEPDYAERSAKAESDPPWITFGKDPVRNAYDYFTQTIANEKQGKNDIVLPEDNMDAMQATREEMNNFIYLYNKQGKEAAKGYYEALKYEWRKRSSEKTVKKAEEFGSEHPILSAAETVASYIPTSLAGTAATAKTAVTGKIDQYDPLYTAVRAREADRAAATETFKTPAGRLIYGAVTSAADNAIAAWAAAELIGLAGGVGVAGASAGKMTKAAWKSMNMSQKAAWAAKRIAEKSAITSLTTAEKAALTAKITGGLMGSNVAASATIEAKQNGLSDRQAVSVGIARGAIELLTEKFSIETIMKEPTTVLKALRKSVLAEGSEEVASNWANRLLDYITNQGLTEEYRENIKQGMSKEDAFNAAVTQAVYEDFESFLGGAIAGSFMTAGGLGVQTAKVGGVKNMNQVLEYQSELAELPEDVRERVIRENEKSYNRARAVELLSKDKPEVSDIAGALNFLDVPEPVQTAHAIENFKNTNETSELLTNDGAKEVVEALAANGYFRKIDDGQLTMDNARAADNAESNYNVNVTERAAEGQNGVQNADSYVPPITVNTQSQTDSDRVKIITESIGKYGRLAYHYNIEDEYAAGYSGSQAVFLNDFNAFYAKGFTGGKIEDVNSRFADRLSLRTRKAAFVAGQRDRAAAIDAKYKAANEAVIRDGGLIMNHNTEGRADAQVFDELGRKFGVTIEIADSVLNDKGKEVNGLYSQGEIKISKKAAESFKDPSAAERFVIKHELLHRVETLAPKHYTKLRELIYNYAQKQNDSSLSVAEQAVLKKNIDMDTAIDEVAADYIGNESFALDVAMHDLTLADRIKGFAKDILDQLGIKKYSEAERIARTWEKACAEAKKTVDKSKNRVGNDVEVKGDVKYSIGYTADNRPVTVIDKDLLKNVPKNQWIAETKKAISKFKPAISVSGRLIKVNAVTENEYLNSKYTKKLRKSDNLKYIDKLNAAGHLDEIILTSTNYVNEDLKHSRSDSIKEFARGKTLLQIGKNQYTAEIVVGFTSSKNMVLYDIINLADTNFKLNQQTKQEAIPNNSGRLGESSADTDNISQIAADVNTSVQNNSKKYSEGDLNDVVDTKDNSQENDIYYDSIIGRAVSDIEWLTGTLSPTEDSVKADTEQNKKLSEREIKREVNRFVRSSDKHNKERIDNVLSQIKTGENASNDSKAASGYITKNMNAGERSRIISGKDINVAAINKETADVLSRFGVNELKNAYSEQAEKVIKRISEQFGIDENNFIGKKLNFDFNYVKSAISENEIREDYMRVAKLFSAFDSVIDNAVGIDLSDYRNNDTDLGDRYVLMSAFNDGNDIIPVQFVVNDEKGKDLNLTVEIPLNANFEAKTNDGQLPTTVKAADFIGENKLNVQALMNFPDNMLKPEQLQMKNNVLGEAEAISRKYVEKRAAREKAEKAIEENAKKDFAEKLKNTEYDYEAAVIKDSMKTVRNGTYSRSKYYNTKEWNKAVEYVEKKGVKAATEKWDGLVKSGKFADQNDIALAERLLQKAGERNDTTEVARLVCDISAMATKSGIKVTTRRLLNKMSGATQLKYIDRVVSNIQKDIDKRFKGKAPKIEIDKELRRDLFFSINSEKTEAITDKILTNVAEQVPSTSIDKWNAWRYLAMLGNPKTHIRNVIGNAVFVPAVKIKNTVAYVIEAGTDKVLKASGKKGIERSKSIKTAFATKEYRDFAALDFEAVKDELTGGGKLNERSIIEQRKSIFKFTPLEKLRVFNDNMLEAEDGLFLKHHYKSALISYLQANKIDVNTLTESNAQGFKTLEKARSYAIQEAQKATYRDANSFSNALNELSKKNKASQFVLDAILPFKKTPANILRRGVEYSPAGLISTLTRGVYKVATGNMTATEFIDNLSSGLTGTAIMAVGAMLSSLGFLTGKPRDDEEEFKENMGVQSYALQFFKDGKTHSYTIDWAVPACMSLFVGAEINRLIENDEKLNLSTFFDSLGTVADPIFELSMLDGINNTLSSVSNMSENEKEIPVILREIITSYFGQGVPTLLGQITRTFADDTRRRTYMDKNSKIPTALQYAAQRQMNKIPGLVKKQEPYVNEWGKADVTESVFERAFENFLSPGYYSVSDENKVNSELIRLSKESTEETPVDVFPKSMPRYFNVDKKRKDLTAKEFTKFQETAGQESFELLQAGFDTDTYKSMTLDERVDFIKTVYDVAKIKGKQAVSDYEPSSDWVKWAIEKGDDAIVNAALFKAKAGEDYFIKIDNMNGFIKSYDAGLDVDGYTQFFLETKGINAKDENGKTVSGLKQKRLIEKLQSMDLTNEERAYYYSTYYENPKNNPWKAYLKN